MTALRLPTRRVRVLDDRDLPALRRMVAADPFVHASLAARLDAAGTLRADVLGGELLGVGAVGEPTAACFVGATLLPVGTDPASWPVLARALAAAPRVCSSLVGRADTVDALWPQLAAGWGPARVIRPRQPLLVTTGPPAFPPDPAVRPARHEDLAGYLPAAVAMFTAELGVPPFHGHGRAAYRNRLAELIAAGRAFVRLDENGRVAFKAELGVVTAHTCQVQGVWVRPELRGHGLGTAAMAAVIGQALRLAPAVSLYVNDFNAAARRLYARLGMRQAGTLATVVF